ncbi:SGNH/GDSL hydrolase family protein [Neobacillus massiliamazoniensis]|jgi:lysophospholipase L1-like esterase|uniref:G-D-S-L family lipolytic protein n=1 Tax=Neobacillus massiliamazoniensis TaxID=1499688 RepID=A0A0U1P151_9BACI|nr:SGNH/GDSL hydrolase family protein [Neobacillus massiliamazoniensis]CRK83812.1 G-D-S-L family lipolytic protein [Neobacillus massiliamazoniensis]
MKKLFTLLILFIFLMTSCSQSHQSALLPVKEAAIQVYKPIPADFLPRKLTVVTAGDSLTEGVGDSTGHGGYIPYIKTMLEKEKGINEVDFYNYGVTGNRTTQLLKRLQSQEMKTALRKADLVILTIGGNDIMKVVKDHISNLQLSDFTKEKESYIVHLQQIMDAIIAENPQVSIVMIGLYNPFSKWFSNIKEMDQIVSDWNQAGQTVVTSYPNAYFVDIQDIFQNTNENLLFTDNFHPNDKGYELIAGRLNETLEKRTVPDLEKKSYMVSKEEN